MKRLNYKIGISIFVLLILALVGIVPASANAPVHVHGVWDAYFLDESCGEPLDAHLQLVSNEFYWVDKDGLPRGESYVGIARGSLAHEGRIVKMVSNENTSVTYLSYQDGILEVVVRGTGTDWKASVPGHGVVAGYAGNLVYTETCTQDEQGEWSCEFGEVLKWSGMDFKDDDVVCNYLLYGE
jgi:hypothetical protein